MKKKLKNFKNKSNLWVTNMKIDSKVQNKNGRVNSKKKSVNSRKKKLLQKLNMIKLKNYQKKEIYLKQKKFQVQKKKKL